MRVHSVSPGSIMHMAVSGQRKTKHPGLLTSTALLYLLLLWYSLEPCKAVSFLSWGEEKGHKDSWPPTNILLSRPLLPSLMFIISAKPASHPHAGEFLKVPSPPSLSAETEVHTLHSCSKLTPESALYICSLLPPSLPRQSQKSCF